MRIPFFLWIMFVLISCHQKVVVPSLNYENIAARCCSKSRASCGTSYKNVLEYLLADTSQPQEWKEKHVSNRNQLEAFKVLVRTEELVLFQSGSTVLKIEKESIIPAQSCALQFYNFEEEGWELDSFIELLNGKTPLGWRGIGAGCSQDLIPRIKSITIGDTFLDVDVIDHLLFPNFTATYFSLQPLQAYWSPDQQFIYLYIFGAPNAEKSDFYHNARKSSYMAKVIIDVEKKQIEGVLAVQGFILSRCGWFCEGFVGF